MFKALKYLLYASLYQKAKSSFILLLISMVVLVVGSFMMNDIIGVSAGMTLYMLMMAKWVLIIAMLGLISFSLLKIINIAMNPFSSKTATQEVVKGTEPVVDTKKENILNKEQIFTESEMILQKYKKD